MRHDDSAAARHRGAVTGVSNEEVGSDKAPPAHPGVLSQLQVSVLTSECIVDTCRVRGERPAACGKGRDRGTVPPRERPRPWRPFPRRALPHRAFPATVAPCHLPHSRRAPCRVRGAHLRDALPAAFELQSSSSTVATVEPLTWRDRRVLVSHTRARSAFPLRGGDPSGACIVRIRCELTERGATSLRRCSLWRPSFLCLRAKRLTSSSRTTAASSLMAATTMTLWLPWPRGSRRLGSWCGWTILI